MYEPAMGKNKPRRQAASGMHLVPPGIKKESQIRNQKKMGFWKAALLKTLYFRHYFDILTSEALKESPICLFPPTVDLKDPHVQAEEVVVGVHGEGGGGGVEAVALAQPQAGLHLGEGQGVGHQVAQAGAVTSALEIIKSKSS